MNYDTISWRQDTLSDPTDGSSPIHQRTIYAGDGVTYFLLMKDDGKFFDVPFNRIFSHVKISAAKYILTSLTNRKC